MLQMVKRKESVVGDCIPRYDKDADCAQPKMVCYPDPKVKAKN